MHREFEAWLKRNGYAFFHSRMDRPTSQQCGDPDFLVVKGQTCAFCEMKTSKGKVSPAQMARIAQLVAAGCLVKIARNVEEAIEHIESVFGSKRAGEAYSAPNEPSSAPPEPKFWVTHSRSLGDVVVCKGGNGDLAAIRLATAADCAGLPRLPARGFDE